MGGKAWERFSVVISAVAAATTFLSPVPAQAGLISNNVVVTLQQTDPGGITETVINNQTVTVSTGVEFSGVSGANADALKWTLDIQADGFTLFGECTSDGLLGGICFDPSILLSLSSLSWAPDPYYLAGGNITEALELNPNENWISGGTRNFASEIVPVVTPSSMSIEFAVLGLQSLGDSVTVRGNFVTAVPEPSVLPLLAIGVLGFALQRGKRTRVTS